MMVLLSMWAGGGTLRIVDPTEETDPSVDGSING